MMIKTYESRLTKTGTVKLHVVAENTYLKKTLNSPNEIVDMVNTLFHLCDMAEEHVYMIAMDSALAVKGAFLLSKGGMSSSIIETREILQKLLLCNANRFIILHNHPSGSLIPSEEDLNITSKMKEAGKICDMILLDHIIVTKNNGFFSFKENGRI